jgi:uncharacterized protein (TIGR03435 family)
MRHPGDNVNPWPTLGAGIQEQLGLKLEAQKSDLKLLVVHHMDHRIIRRQVKSGDDSHQTGFL